MKVQVWNDKDMDHSEKWQGKLLNIPAKGFIEMEADEAHDFKCQFYPPYVDANGVQLKSSFKRIRIVGDIKKVESNLDLKCNACNYQAPTKESLEDHVIAKHADQATDKDFQDEIKKKAGRSNKAG